MQFLKRHALAAIFVVLLLVGGSIDWTLHTISGSPRREQYYGLFRGHLVWGSYNGDDPTVPIPLFRPWEDELHTPTLGRKLEWGRGSYPTINHFEAAVPLYLPLLVIAAWVAFRELKRRKAS